MSKQYTTGDYLGGYICPDCKTIDRLYYEECPSCLDNFVVCSSCGFKSSSEDLDTEMAEE